MITKIDIINMIQMEMVSSVFVKDTRGKFPTPLISRAINIYFESLCKENPIAKEETALEFTLDLKTDGGFYANLTKGPILGAESFVYLKDDIGRILLVSKGMSEGMKYLMGDSNMATLFGYKVKFNKKPSGAIIACYVPNVNDMDDDDILVTSGDGKYLVESVLKLLRSNDLKPKEVRNDNKVDSEQRQ
jgi:hypothetical protein